MKPSRISCCAIRTTYSGSACTICERWNGRKSWHKRRSFACTWPARDSTASGSSGRGCCASPERRDLLERALATLDDESREIVVLRFFQRMQARDIAEIVDSTEGAVRTRLHRILKQLRGKYGFIKEDL